MKIVVLLLMILMMLFSSCVTLQQEPMASAIVHIPSYNGYLLEGVLAMPEDGDADKLVVYINGSGPNTYDNKRELGDGTLFTYFDLFRDEFTVRDIAFFSYNTRGVRVSGEPPVFSEVDDVSYRQYTPQASVKDCVAIVEYLTRQKGLKGAKVILLGWSEGTQVAPLVSLKTQIDGLVLCGYLHDDMMDILDWQQTGGSSMVFYRHFFDYDADGFVSPEEFSEDRNGIAAHFGVTYDYMDQNKDGVMDEADFALMLEPSRTALYRAIDEGDREYLKHDYGIHLTPEWFTAHKIMPSNAEILPFIDIPIHIIHGTFDQNTPVEGAYATQALFEQLGKDNLTVSVYEGYNHDLNYLDYVYTGEIPEGLAEIFTVISGM